MQDQVFKSKVDWWLGLLIGLLFLAGVVGIGMGVYFIFKDQPESGWWNLGTGIFVCALINGLVLPVRYTLAQDELIVQSGLLKSRYAYGILTGAKPSRNLLSSPALSIDRLKITYQGKVGFFLISPVDKDEFMRALAARASHLTYKDGELVS